MHDARCMTRSNGTGLHTTSNTGNIPEANLGYVTFSNSSILDCRERRGDDHPWLEWDWGNTCTIHVVASGDLTLTLRNAKRRKKL